MSDEQYAFYLYLQTEEVQYHQTGEAIHMIKEAQKFCDWSILEIRCGEVLAHHLGDYSQAIDHFMRAYNLAGEEGYLSGMIYASFQIGNCYACVNAEKAMMKYYTRSEQLIRSSQCKKFEGVLWYNIGSTYQGWNQYEKAEHYLLKAYHSDFQNDFLCYHKLVLLYDVLEREKAFYFLEEAKQKYKEKGNDDNELLLRFLELHMNEEGQDSEEYIECLKHICESSCYFYGLRHFHLSYYVDALKKKRRYKEALQILENYHFHKK